MSGYFLGDTKAVLNGCKDHWTLQDRAAIPLLFQMTVCVDIRVVVPGAWVAFSYSSVHSHRPELGLEGDDTALYGWLLRVRHRFPLQLSPKHWHRVCLRRDVLGNSFSLEVISVVCNCIPHKKYSAHKNRLFTRVSHDHLRTQGMHVAV